VTAHVAGLPVEEVVPALVSGMGAWLLLMVTSIGSRRGATATTPTEAEPTKSADSSRSMADCPVSERRGARKA
jgi:hypothetical protein